MTAALIVQLLISLIENANAISQILKGATAAGRTDLTPEEVLAVKNLADEARAQLVAAIKAAGP